MLQLKEVLSWSSLYENMGMIEVACAIIKKENRILIAQRNEKMSHPNRWEFPGGKLKPGETPERGIKREIWEELGVAISVDQLLPSVRYNYGGGEFKLIPFVCYLETENLILKEHKAVRWVSKPEVPHFDLLEADVEVLKILNGRWD